MPDEKKYTEREVVIAARNAYVQGVSDRDRNLEEHGGYCPAGLYTQTFDGYIDRADANAKRLYKLPKRVVPRVVGDVPGWEEFKFRVVGRKFEVTGVHAECWIIQPLSSEITFRDLGPVYADLLATPTEEVEDA